MTTNQTLIRGGIELTGLRKSFGALEAVRGVDLHIAAGETVALLGPNGAGKSTTIDMMLGLSQPDAGSARIFGLSPKEAVAAGQICGMLQVGALVPYLSVTELLTEIASLYPRALPVAEVIELAGLSDFAGQRTNKLSGGQLQRTRFAIALVSNSDLLVLDEPTVALDVEGRRQFWMTMRAIANSGKTVVFATHYLEEADEYADRIVLMAHGRIVADGPTTEIRSLVGSKLIRATLPDVPRSDLAAIDGVSAAERRGEAVVLSCSDSDLALRTFLSRYPAARDIEVAGAGLEEAFLKLTGHTAIDDAETTR
ncbi:ABC transporter ATP-binding protein [Jatrophihabitans telluris]|uniref:ABC transporter ATP-binding protein n=1 Tax=Jatrophihabitans telluris TaxID=2038343 RepID=A0ABY4R1N3_9ACTN|nr:ABC transporter ATP-binding protein [Jatrophihabitans telluris]UQX88929.1 ABC transporter ATP-binding protein [Jatrophihabitans telluris]